MTLRVALHHLTEYAYDRPVSFSPHVVRLRPAPHARTPIAAYTLRVRPEVHFVNWQQDPFGNYQARFVFPDKGPRLSFEVDLVAELTVINPFDFFLEDFAEQFPFVYPARLRRELAPYLEVPPPTPRFAEFVERARSQDARAGRRTVDVLVDLNRRVQQALRYDIRMEPGVFAPEETLERGHGSCRDFAWLLVQLLRHMGLAARFVSGYSIQLKPDEKPLSGPAGAAYDSADLHAWAEVFLPGAGFVGLDATSGLLAGEGHIPLACTPDPDAAAPVTGSFTWKKKRDDDELDEKFSFSMSVQRIEESPRVTLPYSVAEWTAIDELGHRVDAALQAGDVRLTMGGEPTFVAVDDPDGEEWNTGALGPTKRRRASELVRRLYDRFTPGGLLHEGQGKWYPGEPLPRWALSAYFRKDKVPIWNDRRLFAEQQRGSDDEGDARAFGAALAERLGVDSSHLIPAYEDAFYYLWRERRLPVNVDPFDSKLSDEIERARLARIFEQGLDQIVGYVLPLRHASDPERPAWESGAWSVRPERLYLIAGDSPMGFRLPLDSLPWVARGGDAQVHERDPFAPRPGLPHRDELGRPRREATPIEQGGPRGGAPLGSSAPLHQLAGLERVAPGNREAEEREARGAATPGSAAPDRLESDPGIVRTAVCIEPRDGVLHVFMPPVSALEDYLDLCATIENTAAFLGKQVRLEGYHPPGDPRIARLQVTPDPGVIEVNVHPAASWSELRDITSGVYEDARNTGLRAEKFMIDGRHTGTGGGNHMVIGGATAADSPLLRRPDLLRSMVGYWLNHPSLSYLFSGLFVGPTSQSPRVDEARNDSLYELDIACRTLGQQLAAGGPPPPPWLVDRTFRHLLADVTGNTHRTEFCIDKLYSPDGSSGRLGLLELRSFEMPPHPKMSLLQGLLVRALVASFWAHPYDKRPANWGTELHDRFALPHFIRYDFEEVLSDLVRAGFAFHSSWFGPHFEFRFPLLGRVEGRGGLVMELRQAIEPWHVLGEEPGGGGTVRFVDSSVERLEVKVSGMVDERHVVACNGRRVPLHPTGTNGEFVAGVRYRAWQPPSALHPNIPVHAPLAFEVIDGWNDRAILGASYHVSHPGGLAYDVFPRNGFEAESRRAARFFRFGHTPGPKVPPAREHNPFFPFTLDLRR